MAINLKFTTRSVLGTLRRLRRKRKRIDKGNDVVSSFPRHKSQSYIATSSSTRLKCGPPTSGGIMDERHSPNFEELQNIPPSSPSSSPCGEEVEVPMPPRRSSSLFTPGGASTLTMRHSKSPRESASTLNPKRISIATSTFWLGHPDMEKFANTLEFGHETMKTQSVWGASDQGSAGAECVDIWGDPPAVKKGVLMQQREKLWSRWKERYVILTRDYLNCFRRSANVHRSGVTLSEMGSFIFKLRLADVEEIRWENRRSGSLVALVLPQEPRILLRIPNDNTEALHQWYTLLQECIYMSKERRQALRNHHMSTFSKTFSTTKSEDDDANSLKLSKSKSSLSPHTSSDETDVELKSNGRPATSSSRVSGKYSSKNKLTATNSSSTRSSVRKYSPVVVGDDDDDDDDDDYVDKLEESEPNSHLGNREGNSSSSDVEEYVPVQLRRAASRGGGTGLLTASRSGSNLTLNDFVRKPWKPGGSSPEGQQPSHAEIFAHNGNSNGSSCPRRKLSSGYAIPADSLLRPPTQRRPESWTPQSNLFYRTPSLVPSHWVNKRELPLARGGAGPPFGRSTMIVCPSRLTAEVTYIRRM